MEGRKQGAGKKKKAAALFPWRRLALASIVANAALLFVLLWVGPERATRTGAAPGEESRVREFIAVYFGTWSAGDMEGYRRCFHPGATVSLVAAGGTVEGPTMLDPFIEGQRHVVARGGEALREEPLESVIDIDGPVARVLVRWKLTDGAEVKTGVDYFTLLDTRDGWKIVNLVWRQDDR